MRFLPSISIIVFLFAISCGVSSERREYEKLDAAIGLLINAGPDDQSARLEQLKEIKVNSLQLKKLKITCLESFQELVEAKEGLAKTRSGAMVAELEIQRLQKKEQEQIPISSDEKEQLKKLSSVTTKMMEKFVESLENADSLIKECTKERMRLREYFDNQ